MRCGLAEIIVLEHVCGVAQIDAELAGCKQGNSAEARGEP
jgi:hypothetical protein